jgi:hypothetical protein
LLDLDVSGQDDDEAVCIEQSCIGLAEQIAHGLHLEQSHPPFTEVAQLGRIGCL